MTEWITVEHPDVEGTAVVASTALASLSGWTEVAPLVLDVPTGAKAGKSRTAPTETQEI